MTIKRRLLEAARFYESLGLKVVPVARLVRDEESKLICQCHRGAECHDPGKHPLYTGWRDNTTDAFREWGMGGLANVGVQTGAVSNIVVVDIDPRHLGDETLAALEKQHGELPYTWRDLSGGGGEHIIFKHPGIYISGGSDVLGPGIDIRGDGNLIVAPPSLHRSGRQYVWSVDHHPSDTPLAEMPEWMLDILAKNRRKKQRREKPIRPCEGLSRYGEVALDDFCKRVLSAPNGQQEYKLNGEAWSIGRIAGAGGLPVEFTLKVLLNVAHRIDSYDPKRPWRNEQIEAKVTRAFYDGVSNPGRVRR